MISDGSIFSFPSASNELKIYIKPSSEVARDLPFKLLATCSSINRSALARDAVKARIAALDLLNIVLISFLYRLL